MDQLSDTAAFCRVVETGSFTAAAAVLSLSKGAVSKHVARLETRLGVRLLHRTTRRQSLTEAGEAFYRRAVSALEEIAEAERAAAEHAARAHGHLRISVPSFFGAEILSRHIGAFRRRHPDVTLEIGHTNRLVDLLEERVDLAVRMSAPKDSALIMRKLVSIPIAVCAAPSYLAQHGRPQTIEALSEHTCLLYSLMQRPHEWPMLTAEGRYAPVAVGGGLASDSDHTLRQAALDGCGIVRMPKLFLAEALERGDLVQLFDDEATPGVTLAAVYPSRRALPAKTRAFIDFLVEISREWQAW